VPCHQRQLRVLAECLVRTHRTSCIMLKVMVKTKLNPYLFPCSLRQNSVSVFVLSSFSSVDVLLCIKFIRVVA
jgi:hypothetical protein